MNQEAVKERFGGQDATNFAGNDECACCADSPICTVDVAEPTPAPAPFSAEPDAEAESERPTPVGTSDAACPCAQQSTTL